MPEINESYEDYLKTIYMISKHNKGGWVSNSEIADLLHVTPASVTGMLHNLKNNGLIKWKPRSAIRLTPSGKNLARQMHENYTKLREFFQTILKIGDNELINRVCCGIEHHLTPEVVEKLDNIFL